MPIRQSVMKADLLEFEIEMKKQSKLFLTYFKSRIQSRKDFYLGLTLHLRKCGKAKEHTNFINHTFLINHLPKWLTYMQAYASSIRLSL